MTNEAQTAAVIPAGSKCPALKAAWERYLATLEEMRVKIESSPQFDAAPRQRAKAYHILMEAQAVVYNHALAPRMSHPRLFHNIDWQTDVYAMSGAGPDFFYGTVFLDGAQTYRISGHVRDSRLLLAQMNKALPGSPGSKLLANYDFASFKIRDDGTFDIIVSAQKHEGNWIAMDPGPDVQWLLFRPLVESWDARPTELTIERISPIEPNHYDADEFDEEVTARRIDAAAGYVRYMIQAWTIGFSQHCQRNAGGINVFKSIGTEISGEVGSPSAEYVMMVYEVSDDEALILEIDQEPTGLFWSYQVYDLWLRSLDFQNRQTTLHSKQIAKDSDGGIRLVLSRQDPGLANWLDTAGRDKGQILLRDYCSKKSTVPRVHRVNFAELDRHLPRDSKRVSAEDRTAELGRRRACYRRRYGE